MISPQAGQKKTNKQKTTYTGACLFLCSILEVYATADLHTQR